MVDEMVVDEIIDGWWDGGRWDNWWYDEMVVDEIIDGWWNGGRWDNWWLMRWW